MPKKELPQSSIPIRLEKYREEMTLWIGNGTRGECLEGDGKRKVEAAAWREVQWNGKPKPTIKREVERKRRPSTGKLILYKGKRVTEDSRSGRPCREERRKLNGYQSENGTPIRVAISTGKKE